MKVWYGDLLMHINSILIGCADESPPTCGVFLSEQGLDLFMNMLQSLGNVEAENRVQVETKILGLLVSWIFFFWNTIQLRNFQ